MPAGCLQRPTPNPNVLVVAIPSGPNNLDPRVGTDDASQKIHQLIFDNLMELDDHLRVTPKLAERLDHPTPTTYVVTLSSGVRFHDGHELTSADVVYTFRSFLDPDFVSARKGGYRELQSVDAPDRYTVVFTLEPAVPVVPDQSRHADRARRRHRGAVAAARSAPARTGSSATPWTTASSWRPSTTTSAAGRGTTAWS